MHILIIIFSILFTVLAVKRLNWAVFLMLALLPAYQIRFQVLGIPFTLLETMILTSFAIWLIRNWKQILENLKNKIKNRLQITNYKLQITTRYPFDLEIIALLIISWIAIVVAGFSNEALGVWKAYFFEPVLVFILVMNVFGNSAKDADFTQKAQNAAQPKSGKGIEPVLWALTLGAGWIALWAIIERITGWTAHGNFWPRVTGPFPYPNALGLYLGPVSVLLVGWILNKMQDARYKIQNDKIFIVQILSIALVVLLSLFAIMLARSEGAIIGILAAVLVMGLFMSGSKRKKVRWLPAGITGLILLFVFISAPLYLLAVPRDQYFDFHNGGLNYLSDKIMLKDLSGEIRKQQWRETWAMMKDNWRWLTGTGLSGYRAAIAPYHQPGIFFNSGRDPEFHRHTVWDEAYRNAHWQPVEIYMYPHNLLLNFWTELGLAGVILFIWIILKFIYLAFTSYKLQTANPTGGPQKEYLLLGLLGAIIVIVVHGIVDVPYFKNDLAVLFWLLAAMMGFIGISAHIKEKKDNIDAG